MYSNLSSACKIIKMCLIYAISLFKHGNSFHTRLRRLRFLTRLMQELSVFVITFKTCRSFQIYNTSELPNRITFTLWRKTFFYSKKWRYYTKKFLFSTYLMSLQYRVWHHFHEPRAVQQMNIISFLSNQCLIKKSSSCNWRMM